MEKLIVSGAVTGGSRLLLETIILYADHWNLTEDKLAGAAAWYEQNFVKGKLGAGLDMMAELQRWADFLEGAHAAMDAGDKSHHFPTKYYKNSLRNWCDNQRRFNRERDRPDTDFGNWSGPEDYRPVNRPAGGSGR